MMTTLHICQGIGIDEVSLFLNHMTRARISLVWGTESSTESSTESTPETIQTNGQSVFYDMKTLGIPAGTNFKIRVHEGYTKETGDTEYYYKPESHKRLIVNLTGNSTQFSFFIRGVESIQYCASLFD